MITADAEIQIRDHILSDPEQGWVEFWSKYEGFVRSLIRKYHLPIEDAAEVFQEVSLRLAKDENRLIRIWDPKRCSLKGFLAVMVTSTCLNFLKSSFHKFNQLATDIDTATCLMQDPAPSPAERLERLEIIHLLRKSLSAAVDKGFIHQDDALLFELRLGGMSYPEISRLLGIPTETLGTRFHRLKSKLKKHLQPASLGL